MNAIEDFAAQWADGKDFIEAMTSGSTGEPKRIHLLKSDMVRSAQSTNEFFGITADSLLLCPLSVDYIAGKMMWVRGDVSGARVLFAEPHRDLSDCRYSCQSDYRYSCQSDYPVDLLAIVPVQIESAVSVFSPKMVRNIIIGGGPMTTVQEQMLTAAGFNAYATYGMTETCSHVALRKIGADDFFTALPGYRFSTDERSCLVIENPAMSYRRLVTNDVVELLDPKRFRIIGRADNIINSGGEKFSPEQLERLIQREWQGGEFYVTSRKSEVWGEECIAVMEGARDASAEARFMDICRRLLKRHQVPKALIWECELKRTRSGKILRERF